MHSLFYDQPCLRFLLSTDKERLAKGEESRSAASILCIPVLLCVSILRMTSRYDDRMSSGQTQSTSTLVRVVVKIQDAFQSTVPYITPLHLWNFKCCDYFGNPTHSRHHQGIYGAYVDTRQFQILYDVMTSPSRGKYSKIQNFPEKIQLIFGRSTEDDTSMYYTSIIIRLQINTLPSHHC
jgi:hypothetical protein